MMYDAEVVVAGHICLDIIPEMKARDDGAFALPDPGTLLAVGPAAVSTGGAVSNTGVALHRLGVETRLLGKVGDDLFGQGVVRILEQNGNGLAANMMGEAFLGFSAFNTRKITGEDVIDFITYRQMIARGEPMEAAMFERVLGTPQPPDEA